MFGAQLWAAPCHNHAGRRPRMGRRRIRQFKIESWTARQQFAITAGGAAHGPYTRVSRSKFTERDSPPEHALLSAKRRRPDDPQGDVAGESAGKHLSVRAFDEKKVERRSGLAKPYQLGVLGVVVPGPGLFHRRELEDGPVGHRCARREPLPARSLAPRARPSR